MKEVLVFLGAALMLVAPLPYLVDIVRRKTKPNIVTWGTWTMLLVIATAALFAAHEPRAASLVLADTIATGAVAVLGLKYGIAKMDRWDVFCQVGAVLGLVLWLVFNSPMIAIVMTITIDLIATIPTLRHSWNLPDEETAITYTLGAIASLLTLLSLGEYTVAAWVYPLYLLLSNSALTITVSHGQRRAAVKA